MDDLTAFLAARLDEREHFAKIARLAQKHREQMLREVEAVRAIVAAHHPELVEVINADQDERSGDFCLECDCRQWPCPTLRHLAVVYSDHPDYRQEWKS